jgi:hypothetical protein
MSLLLRCLWNTTQYEHIYQDIIIEVDKWNKINKDDIVNVKTIKRIQKTNVNKFKNKNKKEKYPFRKCCLLTNQCKKY